MKSYDPTVLRAAWNAIAPWLTLVGVVLILGSVGLGWLVNGLIALLLFLFLLPIIAVLVLNWWVRRQLVNGTCPVCRYEFMGIKEMEVNCPNCGEPLRLMPDAFERLTPPGTVDVQVVDVETKILKGDSPQP